MFQQTIHLGVYLLHSIISAVYLPLISSLPTGIQALLSNPGLVMMRWILIFFARMMMPGST
jgi:hypothetical protein